MAKNVHIKWERKKTFSFFFLIVLIVHKHNTDCRYYFVYRQKLHWNSSFTFLLVWFYCGCIEKLFPCFLLFLCSDIHLSLYPRFKFVCGVNLSPFQKNWQYHEIETCCLWLSSLSFSSNGWGWTFGRRRMFSFNRKE